MKIQLQILILLSFLSCFSQPKSYAFEEVTTLQKKEARPIVIFMNTEWCSYCHLMKNKTLQSESNIKLLDTFFYFIDFNPEIEQSILWNNTVYPFVPKGIQSGTNALAVELGTINGQLSYPILVVLDRDYKIVFRYSGYLNSKEFQHILELIKN